MRQDLTGKIYLQKLQTFAYLCLGLPLLFFIYSYLESSVDELIPLVPIAYNVFVFFPVLILTSGTLFLGAKSFKSSKLRATEISDFNHKLQVYQKASNTRFLSYGISTLLVTIGFYITNYQPFAILFGIMMVLFSINNPSTRKIVTDLKLKGEEKKAILTGSEIK
jgi:hypothetical protein